MVDTYSVAETVIGEWAFVHGSAPDIEFVLSRTREVPVPAIRQIIAYILRYRNGMTVEAIGKELGLSHSTIIHSIKEVRKQMSVSSQEAIVLGRSITRLDGDEVAQPELVNAIMVSVVAALKSENRELRDRLEVANAIISAMDSVVVKDWDREDRRQYAQWNKYRISPAGDVKSHYADPMAVIRHFNGKAIGKRAKHDSSNGRFWNKKAKYHIEGNTGCVAMTRKTLRPRKRFVLSHEDFVNLHRLTPERMCAACSKKIG